MSLSKRIKRHVSATPHLFRVICHLGFEKTCAKELQQLGLVSPCTISDGAIFLEAKIEDAWRFLAFSRTATRIEMQIAEFRAENFGRLEKKSAEIPWELYFFKSSIPAVHSFCKKSRLYHSDAISERVSAIIQNALNERGILPADLDDGFSPAWNSPTQTIFVRLENDICKISLDLAGEPLYKRGFNRHVESAPVRDTLAASILFEAEFYSKKILLDPMAGSGTFSLEAALFKAQAHLNKTRHFATESLPFFRPAAWNFLTSHFQGIDASSLSKIAASDFSEKAFSTLLFNLISAGAAPFLKNLPAETLQISRANFFDLPQAKAGTLLVLNPPYGKRISADITTLYREIGKKIRSDFTQADIAIMIPGLAAEKAFALTPNHFIKTSNGGIDVKVFFIKNG